MLFGSRARGDYSPESDWDFALLYEGDLPSLDGLPSTLQDRDVDWVPIKRSGAVRRRNVCGVPHAVAAHGHGLHGVPLPQPERRDGNIPDAWDLLFEAHGEVRGCLHDLVDHWTLPVKWRRDYNTSVARRSAMAGELPCKAVLSMRGVEPRRSHTVAELCGDLERAFPSDPLPPVLRVCDGLTEKAHVNVYPGLRFPREDVDVSARRMAGVLHAVGEAWAAMCDASFAEEGRDWTGRLAAQEDWLRREVSRLASSDCPEDILRQLQAGLNTWSDRAELWERLLAAPSDRSPESRPTVAAQEPLGP